MDTHLSGVADGWPSQRVWGVVCGNAPRLVRRNGVEMGMPSVDVARSLLLKHSLKHDRPPSTNGRACASRLALVLQASGDAFLCGQTIALIVALSACKHGRGSMFAMDVALSASKSFNEARCHPTRLSVLLNHYTARRRLGMHTRKLSGGSVWVCRCRHTLQMRLPKGYQRVRAPRWCCVSANLP